MEPVPRTVPLPCFGFELDVRSPQCLNCPHLLGCQIHFGVRRLRVPMDRVRFNLLPDSLRRKDVAGEDDPELVYINDLYAQCYQLVFNTKFKKSDNIQPHAAEIADAADKLKCSIRLYILACMIGYQRHRNDTVGIVEAGAREFQVSHLLGNHALERVRMHADLCRQQFGTFTLEAIDLIAKPPHDTNEIDQEMRISEITAARYLIRHKLRSLTNAEKGLYAKHEFDLGPRWLAIEPSYYDKVLRNYMTERNGSDAIQRHRYNVMQWIGQLKRKPNHARAMHLSRNSVMKSVLIQILGEHRLTLEDLESQIHEVTDAFEFWKELGRAIAQLKCLHMYYGEDLTKNYL